MQSARILTISLALFLMSQFSAQAAPAGTAVGALSPGVGPVSNARIDENIDARLPVDARQIMHAVMLMLPPTHRHNVVFYALDGRLYANRQALLNVSRIYRPVPGRQNTYVSKFGDTIAGPGDDPMSLPGVGKSGPGDYGVPPPTGNNGAFRRVYSRPGYSVSNSTVYVPCHDGSMFPGDTGYIYSGGWSNFGNAVDAGFQWSSVNDWYNGFTSTSIGGIQTNGIRLACGQALTLQYFVLDPGDVELYATGYDIYGTFGAVDIVRQVPSNSGWSIQGTGCVLKRMTTIAQPGNRFTDGSFFALDSFERPQVHWYFDSLEYFNNSQYVQVAWNQNTTGGFQNWPNDFSKIIVSYVNQGEETDGLYLHR